MKAPLRFNTQSLAEWLEHTAKEYEARGILYGASNLEKVAKSLRTAAEEIAKL